MLQQPPNLVVGGRDRRLCCKRVKRPRPDLPSGSPLGWLSTQSCNATCKRMLGGLRGNL